MIRAVVFDVDGTLVDTMAAAPLAYVDTVRALGGPQVTVDEVVSMWDVGPTPMVLAELLGRPVSAADVERYFARFADVVAEVRPFAGIPELLETLRGRALPLGVVTGATRRAAELILRAAGLRGHFAVVVGGDESAPKPAAAPLLAACAGLGVTPAAAAYVGDGVVDLGCAEAAGARGIHATWGGAMPMPGEHDVAVEPADVLLLVAG